MFSTDCGEKRDPRSDANHHSHQQGELAFGARLEKEAMLNKSPSGRPRAYRRRTPNQHALTPAKISFRKP